MAEIAEKNAMLEQMGSLLDASAKSKKQEADKSVREVDLLRKQLREERKLKKSAIHKVDDLMSQVRVTNCCFFIKSTSSKVHDIF